LKSYLQHVACSIRRDFMPPCLLSFFYLLTVQRYSVVYPSARLHGVTSQKHFVISVFGSVRA